MEVYARYSLHEKRKAVDTVLCPMLSKETKPMSISQPACGVLPLKPTQKHWWRNIVMPGAGAAHPTNLVQECFNQHTYDLEAFKNRHVNLTPTQSKSSRSLQHTKWMELWG